MAKQRDVKYKKPTLGTKLKLGGINNANEEFAKKFFRFYFTVLYKRMQPLMTPEKSEERLTKEQLKWLREAKPTYEEYADLFQQFPEIWEMEARRHGLTTTRIKYLKSVESAKRQSKEQETKGEEEANFSLEAVK